MFDRHILSRDGEGKGGYGQEEGGPEGKGREYPRFQNVDAPTDMSSGVGLGQHSQLPRHKVHDVLSACRGHVMV